MKKLITTLAVTSALATSALSFQAAAVEGLSANVAMTSNYLWRGVTQNTTMRQSLVVLIMLQTVGFTQVLGYQTLAGLMECHTN